jgi:hypothetical protein
MELPTELRLMIYEEVFQDVLSGCPLSYPLRPGWYECHYIATKRRLKRVLALGHTSHTFNAESIGIHKKLVAAMKSSIYEMLDEHKQCCRRASEVGEHVLSVTADARGRLRELKSMEKLLRNRRW